MNGIRVVKKRDPQRIVLAALAVVCALLLLGLSPLPGLAQAGPSDDGSVPPIPEPLPDGENLYAEFDEVIATLTTLAESSTVSSSTRKNLLKAKTEVAKAQENYVDLELSLTARNSQMFGHIKRAILFVRKAGVDTNDVQMQLSVMSRFIAVGYLRHAEAVGVDGVPLAKATTQMTLGDAHSAAGAFDKAVQAYGNVFKNIGPSLKFDMDLFEQAIQVRFEGQVTGMAYVINNKGALAREYEYGSARQSGEPGNTGIHLFSVDTEIMVASVSKNITAVGVMRLLQENGLTPDDSVAPYFPEYWDVPASIQNLTFRDLMTHRSGLNGHTGNNGVSKCGSTYAALKACIEQGISPANKQFGYQNSNYGLFRLILPYMADGEAFEEMLEDIDCNDGGLIEFACDAALATSMGNSFEELMRCKVFDKMKLGDAGVGGCNDGPSLEAEQLPQTLMYSVPGAVENGFATPAHYANGGGYGWYFSARELAQFQAYLRYSNNVLNQNYRNIMNGGYLGWLSPTIYGGWTDSTTFGGSYRMHGGDWFLDSNKEIHTCVVDFTQGIQIALVINSNAGVGSYQCNELKIAYDAAWIAK